MTNTYSLLTPDTIRSPRLLDAWRELIRDWTLSLYDPESGGFCGNDEVGPNIMSTTDVIWMRYASNVLDLGAPDRDAIVRYIQGKQDPKTGLIPHDPEPAGQGHIPAHAFWQAVRALNILGGDLAHYPRQIESMLTVRGLDTWFESWDWDQPGRGPNVASHHNVLGLIPGIVSTGDAELVETLFRNIAAQQHPERGTWPRPLTNISRTFAYTALHMSTGRLPQMPERILDEVLRLQNELDIWDEPLPGFHTMDSTYLLVRLAPAIGYRFDDCTAALRRVSDAMRSFLAEEQAAILTNTHRTLAVTHTFGLLQEAFPDELRSERPYRFDWDKLDLYRSKRIAQGRSAGPGE